MKKFIMLSALVAATSTAFVACSSDDDLAQQPKAPETNTNCPFNFIVGMDNGTYTRGAGAEVESDMVVSEDMDVTRASVISANPFTTDGAGFNLYGLNGSGMMWDGDAKAYSFNGTSWTGGGDWSGTSGDCYFYAVSYAGSNNTSYNKAIPTGTASDAVSFVYELPNEEVATNIYNFILGSQEDLLVAHSVEKTGTDTYGTDLVGQTSGDVYLNFSHALSNLEIKAIMPTDVYSADDNGKYEEGVSSFDKFFVMYLKSITIHNLPVSGTYTYGAATPWSVGTSPSRANVEISWDRGVLIPPVSYKDALGAPSTGVDAFIASLDPAVTRKQAEHALYTPIAAGATSVMVIPHQSTTCGDSFSTEDEAIFIEVNCYIVQVLDDNSDIVDFTDAANVAKIQTFFDDAQGTGTDWAVDFTKTAEVDALLQGDDTKPYYCWGVNVYGDKIPTKTGSGFFCGDGTNKSSYYIKFNSAPNFEPNKKYTLYIDFNNLRANDGTVISAI